MRKLILASQSPRRKELLEKCGIPFETEPADIDETLSAEGTLEEQIRILSRRKAEAVLKLHPEAVVLGSDTIVAVNGEILGKPADEAEAAVMLRKLAGNTHQVITGVCLISRQREYTDVSVSDVTFAPMSDKEIAEYISTGECMDKAGAYGIQGYGGKYITHIKGDFYAIMGLPLNLVYEEMKNINEY